MSNDIRIKKGLDIKLKGEAEKTTDTAVLSNFFVLRPEDFHGVIPKLISKVGTKVKAGEPVFYDKSNEDVKFVSPVSGEVIEISRGAKRKILEIKIQADKTQTYQEYDKFDVDAATPEKVKSHLLASGLWPFIKQRPYDVIANPEKSPKAIFISGYASAPLAADLDYTLQGKEAELQAAVSALGKLTEGQVHVGVGKNANSPLAGLSGVSLHKVSGPHPAGNVGTLINKIDPVNKGETVWTVSAQDLVIIGELLLTGKFNAERIVALAGSEVKSPRYLITKIGAEVATMIFDKGVEKDANARIISGSVLTGKEIKPDGYLDYYSNVITIIPEGDDYEFFGWTKPVFNKISTSRALTFSWLNPKKEYDLNTNTNGEERAFVLTGEFEKVLPMDVLPNYLFKAIMAEDYDEMEALGIFELIEEDVALCEFIDVSKHELQAILRKGINLMING